MNTVNISLKEYNEFRDIAKAINTENYVCFSYSNNGDIYGMKKEEVVDSLNDEIIKLNEKIIKLECPEQEVIYYTKDNIKNMSIIKFIKFKLNK